MDVRKRTELPEETLRALQMEVLAQVGRGKKFNQSSLAKAAKLAQAAIHKVVARGEAGRDVAEALLKPLGFKNLEELVKKHKTLATANDLAIYLHEYPPLAETLRKDPTRWPVDTLVRLVVRLRMEPNLSRADKQPSHGTWSELLDEEASGREPKVLETIESIERPKPRKT